MGPPALAITIKVGIEKTCRYFVAQFVMFDDCRKVKERVVVASVFPIEKHDIGCCNDVGGDEIVMATTQIVRQAHCLDKLSAVVDKR